MRRTPMRRALIAALLLAVAPAPAQTLDLYFVDVEQGSAMLVVTPSREAVLIEPATTHATRRGCFGPPGKPA